MKPYCDEAGIQIYHGDNSEIVPDLPQADVMLTDPPYGRRTHLGARTNAKGNGKLVDFESIGIWQLELDLEDFAPKRWLVCTCDFLHAAEPFQDPPGKKHWNGGGLPATWRTGIAQGYHPTQKPLSLLLDWVKKFSDPGETILDPWMGSGTTLRAAKDLGRKAIGIETDERYAEIAAKRLSQEVFDFGQPAEPEPVCA